jgi:hypothetical protein
VKAIYTDKVLEAAVSLGGDDSQGLQLFCESAQEEIMGRLRENVQPEDFQEIFITASAMLALAGYRETGADGGAASYTAGRISVQGCDGGAVGGSFRRQAEVLLAPYVEDRDFYFMGVDG